MQAIVATLSVNKATNHGLSHSNISASRKQGRTYKNT